MCEERELDSLGEARVTRRMLDQVWNDGGTRRCLEMAQWKFAMRAVRAEFTPNVTPGYGFKYAFEKGSDWVITSAVCYDERYESPCIQYTDEIGYWMADVDELYIKYVSDGETYGGDLSRWPATFTDAVKGYFAQRIVGSVSGADENKINRVVTLAERYMRIAKNKDAMAGPVTFPVTGAWVRARTRGGTGNWADGGSRTRLIG